MIRLGRYDVLDKWEIVCRSWAGDGPALDLGVNRHGNKQLLPEWQSAAFREGYSYCIDYIRLKCEALNYGVPNAGAAGDGEDDELNEELSRLLQEVGYDEFRARGLRLVDGIKSSGVSAASDELPPRVADRLKEAFKLGALLALRWTEDIGEIPDLEVLRAQAKPAFPLKAIQGKRNVLAMFCVRYYGMLDVIHIHDAGPDQVTLVDFDAECLEAVQRIYPRQWNYVLSDYKDFLREAEARGLVYDLIVADPWRVQCPEVGFDMLSTIMSLCSDMFVMHYVKEMFDELGVAWTDFAGLSRAIKERTGVDVMVTDMVERSTENCWLVLRKPNRVTAGTEAAAGLPSAAEA
jgi:hypothetical protein